VKNEEAMLRRREADIKKGEEELARALAKSLVLLNYRGKCHCGLMLTERDQVAGKDSYRCPHCGRSGPLAATN
jgi:hypothetical protein